LFSKKNIQRKIAFRDHLLGNKERVQCFAFAHLREEVLGLLKYYDEDRDNALSTHEYAGIFEDLKNTYVTEVQMSDSFALIDENMDGELDEDELLKNPFELMKFVIREKTLIELKKKFVII
jgi:hypothetical protein